MALVVLLTVQRHLLPRRQRKSFSLSHLRPRHRPRLCCEKVAHQNYPYTRHPQLLSAAL